MSGPASMFATGTARVLLALVAVAGVAIDVKGMAGGGPLWMALGVVIGAPAIYLLWIHRPPRVELAPGESSSSLSHRLWRLRAWGAAAALVGVGLWLLMRTSFEKEAPIERPAGAVLWILGIAVAVRAAWRLDPAPLPPSEPDARRLPGLAFLILGGGVAAAFVGQHLLRRSALGIGELALPMALLLVGGLAAAAVIALRPALPRWDGSFLTGGRELVVLLGLVAFGIVARFWKLDDVPPGLFQDEAALGDQILRVGAGQYPLRPGWSAHPDLFLVPAAFSLKAFGVSPWSLRLPYAVISCFALPFFYGFCRWYISVPAAVIATLLWDSGRVSLHVARFIPWNHTIPLVMVMLYFVHRAIAGGSRGAFAFGGVACGLMLYTCLPANGMVPILGLYLVLRAAAEPGFLRRCGPGILAGAAVAAAVVAPLAGALVRDPEPYRSFFESRSISAGALTTDFSAFWDNIQRELLMFNFRGPSYAEQNYPYRALLDDWSAPLLAVGVWLGVLTIGRPSASFPFVWWILGMGFAYLNRNQNPHMTHGMLSIPAAYILVGLSADRIAAAVRAGVPFVGKVLAPLLLVGWAAWVTAYNWDWFFVKFANERETFYGFSGERTAMIRHFETRKNPTRHYMNYPYFESFTIDFLAQKRFDLKRVDVDLTVPVLERMDKDAEWLLIPAFEPVLASLRRVYPGGNLVNMQDPWGTIYVHRYEAPRELVARAQEVVVRHAGAEHRTRAGLYWQIGKDLPSSLASGGKVEAEGTLFLPEWGTYRLHAAEMSGARLALNGDPVPLDAWIALPRGRVTIRLSGIVAPGAKAAGLMWRRPDRTTADEPVDKNLTAGPTSPTGWEERTYKDKPDEGPGKRQLVYRQLTPFLLFDPWISPVPMEKPYTLEWETRLHADEAGRHTLRIESSQGIRMWFDGKLVADGRKGGYPRVCEASLEMVPGRGVTVLVVFEARENDGCTLRARWRRPGGAEGPLPDDSCAPPVRALAAEAPKALPTAAP